MSFILLGDTYVRSFKVIPSRGVRQASMRIPHLVAASVKQLTGRNGVERMVFVRLAVTCEAAFCFLGLVSLTGVKMHLEDTLELSEVGLGLPFDNSTVKQT